MFYLLPEEEEEKEKEDVADGHVMRAARDVDMLIFGFNFEKNNLF